MSNAPSEKLLVSVIVCTHNPRLPLLQRVVGSLRNQDLPIAKWQLLIVDNRSVPPVDAALVSWHPMGLVIREEELGLTHARLRGIRESTGELIVFVDDDNILDRDYLSSAVDIAAEHSMIGAFGASMRPEYEVQPPKSIKPYLEYVAGTEVTRDSWSSFAWKWATPAGGGLCVRRPVGERYLQMIAADPLRRSLDRSGDRLSSGGDHDLALTATDMGLGVGRFCRLKLSHVIGRQRLNEEYIIRLYAGIGHCTKILDAIRPHFKSAPKSRVEKLRLIWQLVRGPRFERRLILARRKAERDAVRDLASLGR